MRNENDIIHIITRLLNAIKIDDMHIYFTKKGVLKAKDSLGNRWTGAELLRFITEEALCFDANGNLVQGQYVPTEILEPYKALSIEMGIIPGKEAK